MNPPYSSGARTVKPSLNNPMGYSYRCRVFAYTSLFRRVEKWGYKAERYFTSWEDVLFGGQHRGFSSRAAAQTAANHWLDHKDKHPESGDYVS